MRGVVLHPSLVLPSLNHRHMSAGDSMKTLERPSVMNQQLQQIYEDCLILPEYMRKELVILLTLSTLNDEQIKKTLTAVIKERGVNDESNK